MADSNEVHEILCISRKATEALAAHRLVIQTAALPGECEYPAAQYDAGIIGVTMHAAAAGEDVKIGKIGIFLVQVDGAAAGIALGDPLGVHNDTGYAQDVQGAASRPYVATAMAISSADGDVIMAAFPGGQMLTTV
jgi:hypothetical protein